MTILALEQSIQLVPDGTLLFHLVLLLLMVGVLTRTLYRPINRVLAEREEQTSGRFSQSRKLLKETSERIAEYERRLREARGAAYKRLEAERAAAIQERERQLSGIRDEIRASVAHEKEALNRQVEEARKTLANQTASNAAEITSKILRS